MEVQWRCTARLGEAWMAAIRQPAFAGCARAGGEPAGVSSAVASYQRCASGFHGFHGLHGFHGFHGFHSFCRFDKHGPRGAMRAIQARQTSGYMISGSGKGKC
jgi:hypothetical protein